MESGDICIREQGVDAKVIGGTVNVGPQIIVDGDINTVKDIRNLICCNCSNKVST